MTAFAVALVPGCPSGPRDAAPVPTAHDPVFAGRVTHVDAGPSAGAVITVSDAKDGNVLTVVRAEPDGRFVTKLPRGRYGVTAADATGWAYAPLVDGSRGDVTIRLDSTCQPYVGRIRTDTQLPADAVVQLGRQSQFTGDTFSAALSADGTFHTCLPAALYFVTPPPDLVPRISKLRVPATSGVVYRTAPKETADQAPADTSGLEPESEEQFVARLPATIRLLGLAESNHGTHEFYEERTSLVLRLANEQGVRLLLLEAGYGEVLVLDEYVNGATIDVDRAVQDLGYWVYDTKDFIAMLRRIREYNSKRTVELRIHLIGFDVQDTMGCIKYLLQHAASAFPADVSSALEKLSVKSGKAWTTLTSAQRTAIRASLGGLAAARGTGDASSESNRTMLAARTLLHRFDLLEVPSDNVSFMRDAAMAQMAIDILATEPHSRATLWAHLGHLSRDYSVGDPPMGSYLASAFGDAYRVYALLAVRGSARAWDEKGEIGVVAQPLRAAAPGGLENVLASRSGDAHVTYFTFADATGEVARWLKGVHLLRSFGSAFIGEWENAYWNLEGIDGAILFDSVSPTEPTPTGERHATPKTP